MFSYKVPIAIVTTVALLRSPIVIAQDIAEVNNIARNISVKITGYGNGSEVIFEREGNVYSKVWRSLIHLILLMLDGLRLHYHSDRDSLGVPCGQ